MMMFIKKRPFIFFILPGFILYTAICIYSIVSAIPYSLTKWSGIGKPQFVGLDNYITIFTHPMISQQFYNALKNNILLTFWGYVTLIPLSVIFAYLMFRKIPGHSAFKLVSFSPHFVNFVTMGFMVTLFFDPNIGLMNTVLKLLGIEWSTAKLFESSSFGIPYITIVYIWKSLGYFMLLVFANFNMIPSDYEEAATIDGANEFQIMRYIYFPLLKPSLINIFIIHYIWGISAFEIPYVLAGDTGGVAGNMDVAGLFFYRMAFSANTIDNSMGMGSTIATIMFVLVLLGAAVQLKMMKASESND